MPRGNQTHGGEGWGMCVGQRVLLVGLGLDAEHVPFMGYGMEIRLPSGAVCGGDRVPYRRCGVSVWCVGSGYGTTSVCSPVTVRGCRTSCCSVGPTSRRSDPPSPSSWTCWRNCQSATVAFPTLGTSGSQQSKSLMPKPLLPAYAPRQELKQLHVPTCSVLLGSLCSQRLDVPCVTWNLSQH